MDAWRALFVPGVPTVSHRLPSSPHEQVLGTHLAGSAASACDPLAHEASGVVMCGDAAQGANALGEACAVTEEAGKTGRDADAISGVSAILHEYAAAKPWMEALAKASS